MTRAIDRKLDDLEKRQAQGGDRVSAIVDSTGKTQEEIDQEVAERIPKLRAQGYYGPVVIMGDDAGPFRDREGDPDDPSD